jgi:hypothetical protein
MEDVGIHMLYPCGPFHGLWVYFVAIEYMLWPSGTIFPVLVCRTEKNLAALFFSILWVSSKTRDHLSLCLCHYLSSGLQKSMPTSFNHQLFTHGCNERTLHDKEVCGEKDFSSHGGVAHWTSHPPQKQEDPGSKPARV